MRAHVGQRAQFDTFAHGSVHAGLVDCVLGPHPRLDREALRRLSFEPFFWAVATQRVYLLHGFAQSGNAFKT